MTNPAWLPSASPIRPLHPRGTFVRQWLSGQTCATSRCAVQPIGGATPADGRRIFFASRRGKILARANTKPGGELGPPSTDEPRVRAGAPSAHNQASGGQRGNAAADTEGRARRRAAGPLWWWCARETGDTVGEAFCWAAWRPGAKGDPRQSHPSYPSHELPYRFTAMSFPTTRRISEERRSDSIRNFA